MKMKKVLEFTLAHKQQIMHVANMDVNLQQVYL